MKIKVNRKPQKHRNRTKIMPHTIKPFRATYYNPAVVKNFSSVTCPPYDVISEKQESLLKRKSLYNFCNVLLARGGDYKAIGRKFRRWIAEKILIDDTKESLYLYEQKFTVNGAGYVRFGILALLKTTGKGAIFPHEYTLKAPKEDRKKIIKEVKTNLSPVFVIAPHPLAVLRRAYQVYSQLKPFLKFRDSDANPSRVWKIEDRTWMQKLCRAFDSQKLVIADGHHRFEVAYNYYKKNKSRFRDLNYILAYITDSQKGLVVLPTHRIVSAQLEADVLKAKLGKYFYVEEVNEKDLERKLAQTKDFCFGVYHKEQFYFLKLKNRQVLDRIFKGSVYKNLDTYLLHQWIFVLCDIKGEVRYTHQIREAKQMAAKDKTAFILKSSPLDAVFKIANQGYRLPQKSTYFYPKVFSGIVVRRFQKHR